MTPEQKKKHILKRQIQSIVIASLIMVGFQNCAPNKGGFSSDLSSENGDNGQGGGSTGASTTGGSSGGTSGDVVNLPAGKTYYIRADGGDRTQCTGKTDAAYPGAGSGVECAWKHPHLALPPKDSSFAPIPGGSAVIIKNGNYKMGLGGSNDPACNSAYPYDCYMKPIPSGTVTEPTLILGENYATGCSAKPELWGAERASMIINLEGSNNVQLRCLEVTDHAECIEFYGPNTTDRCQRDTYPYGNWASAGIYAKNSNNVILDNVNVNGLANTGIHAGKISNWTIKDSNIDGNGWVGWNGDVGATDSSNSGTIHFLRSTIEWNGCIERANGTHTNCWGQQMGGYGDGIGTAATVGDWIFEKVTVQYNTSDGIDMLYLKDGATVKVIDSWVGHNAGNQIKTTGTATIKNNVVVGDCAFHEQYATMDNGDLCRALGNALSLNYTNTTTILENNTVTSEGDCVVLSDGTGTVQVNNNIFDSRVDWRQNFENSAGFYHYSGTLNKIQGVNVYFNAKEGCPAGQICSNPQFTSTVFESFNPLLAVGSPATGKGANLSTVTPNRN